MSYFQCTGDDRRALAVLVNAGMTQAAAATQIGKDPSTVSRERKRNTSGVPGRYHAGSAERQRKERRRCANQRFRKITNDRPLQRLIIRRLKQHWSPEQIAGRLRRDAGCTVIGKDALYAWIANDRPDLRMYLRCRKGKYRRKKGTKQREKRREEAKKKRIDTRPAMVETRERIGDWEGDTIIGGERTQRILTHVERRSRYATLDKLDMVSAGIVREKTTARFARIPRSKKQTCTDDNGTEFSEHAQTEIDTGITMYFAYPYHSWERGTNENTNGLIREFFPKGTPFADVTQADCDRVARLLNTRPRKTLQYATPAEVFSGRVAL